MDDIKICVIGAGRWGKNHVKTLFELDALGGVVDPDTQQRNKIKELFVGNNSIWVGDKHKLGVSADGDMKIRKRIKEV